jgi:hypothetical protein
MVVWQAISYLEGSFLLSMESFLTPHAGSRVPFTPAVLLRHFGGEFLQTWRYVRPFLTSGLQQVL